jgi:ABC-type glycerol-3-phosphate transport system substrate-binding protein
VPQQPSAQFAHALHQPRLCGIGQDRGRHGSRLALRHLLPLAGTSVHRRHRRNGRIPGHSARQHPPAIRAGALAGGGSFDVYIADQVWLPEFYQKGFIKDLSGAVTDADKADFSKTSIETVTDDGALVALPIMVHNCAMYYRTNLFEKAGLSGAPKSWDEYRDFAKKTTDSANGIFGTMVCSKQSIEAATRLHSFYQQAGGDLLDASGAPTINSDAGRAALEFMVALVADGSAPEGVLNELPDMQGRWLEGKLAMAPSACSTSSTSSPKPDPKSSYNFVQVMC